MSRRGAEFVLNVINSNPRANLALATGKTPELMYELLAKKFRRLRYTGCIFNLDEYAGFSEYDEVSNQHFLHEKFLNHASLSEDQIHLIDGKSEDATNYCKLYEMLIAKCGGLDLAILGLGPDGHVANVMPGNDKAALKARTNFVKLPSSFIEYHAVDFAKLKSPPTHSITMGMGTVSGAKIILMMVSGTNKAQAVKNMLEGGISPLIPASILRQHKNCVCIIDEGAASLLKVSE